MPIIGNPRSFHKKFKFVCEIDDVATSSISQTNLNFLWKLRGFPMIGIVVLLVRRPPQPARPRGPACPG